MRAAAGVLALLLVAWLVMPVLAQPAERRMLPTPIVAEIRGAQMFLRKLGADWHDPHMAKAVIAWFRQESGSVAKVIGNNPFNVRPGAASKYANGVTSANYLVFPTLNRGFGATAAVLLNGRYNRVVRAARNGDAIGFLAALARSPWSASRYGVRTYAEARTTTNHLVAVYAALPMPERKGLRVPSPPETSIGEEP